MKGGRWLGTISKEPSREEAEDIRNRLYQQWTPMSLPSTCIPGHTGTGEQEHSVS